MPPLTKMGNETGKNVFRKEEHFNELRYLWDSHLEISLVDSVKTRERGTDKHGRDEDLGG